MSRHVQDESFFPSGPALWLSVAEPFRKVRRELGMTQEQLAKRVGTYQHSIARVENSDTGDVRFSTLKKIAQGLGCELCVTLLPKEEMRRQLEERSRRLAEKLVSASSGNMAMELQGPGRAVCDREVKKVQGEILKRYRSALWELDE